MSVGGKATVAQVGIWSAFVMCGAYASIVPSMAWLAGTVWMSSSVLLATWLWTLSCPRCGHNVASRPVKWLHDFPQFLPGTCSIGTVVGAAMTSAP